MPFYEYKCQDCGLETEIYQAMHDEPIAVCPKCQGRLHRLVTMGAGLIFKGSGFYETDYKRKETSNGKSNGNGHHKPAAAPADDKKSDDVKAKAAEPAKALATADHTD